MTIKASAYVAAITIFCIPASVCASNKISSPNIQEDKLTAEYRGGYDFDDSPGKDGYQLNKFVVNYGVTDRIRPEFKLLYQDSPHSDPRVAGLELSVLAQIFKPSEAWAALSFESYYKPVFLPGVAHRLEEKFLAEKDTAHVLYVGYLTTEKEIGADSRGSVTVTAAGKARYKLASYFQPGVEFYVDLHRLDGERRYQIGPIVGGALDEHWNYEVGYLFGAVNEAVPDSRLKIIVSYGIVF